MNSYFLSITCILTLSLGELAYSQTEAPTRFRINNIRSNGTGCPAGSVAVNVSDDQQAYTLSFSQFNAEVSPATARTEQRKNCRLVFDTEQDAGWEYSILAVNFRGYVALDAGVTAQQNLRMGGQGRENGAILTLNGPYDDDYINSQQVGLGNLRWSGCQTNKFRDFVIDANLVLRTNNPQGRGLFTVDSVDGEIRQEYEILWRSCQEKAKRFISTCSLEAANPQKGSTRSIFSKGQGRSEAMAMQKARNRMVNKCSRLNSRGLTCDANSAVCQVAPF